MSWDVGAEDGQVKVVLEQNGDTHEKLFDSNTKVGDAVKEVAQANNIKRFDVEDADGNEISESESNDTLGDVGSLTMRPAAAGK